MIQIIWNYQKYSNMNTNTKKYINLEFIVDIKNYRESFEKWMKIRITKSATHHQQLFNRYLQVIKPVIHRFSHIISSVSPSQYGFYCTTLSPSQISVIKAIFIHEQMTTEPLQPFEILNEQPTTSIDNIEAQNLIIKNWTDIYRIDLTTVPNNEELQWWGEGLDICPVQIEGVVVTGKGEGRKNLGMPTANIQLDFQLKKKLDEYPNGVYLVDFDFVNGRQYQGAACLGTNPHYENFQESRRVEVYVIHDFGESTFYNQKVVVRLRRLIRFEGKFHSFDAFLQAMHNDIHIASMSDQVKKETDSTKI